MSSHSSARRHFLGRAAGLAAMGTALPLGLNLSALTRAAAQSSGAGYRALVCLFFNGGNDAFNTVLATDSGSWSSYLTHRQPTDGSSSIALMAPGVAANPAATGNTPERLGGVLPIAHAGRAVHAGRQFALHPALTRTQQLYQAGRVAVLANVGPLTRPTTKADYESPSASKPAKLFSHNDQQSTWQTFQPEGAGTGWGGRMGDARKALNGAGRNAADMDLIQRMFTTMTPSNAGPWLAGREVLPYQSSVIDIQGLGSGGRLYGSTALQQGVASMLGALDAQGQPVLTADSLLQADLQHVTQRALQASQLLSAYLPALGQGPWSSTGVTDVNSDPLLKYTSPVDGSLKTSSLALQLQMVARLIDTNRTASLGIGRQFFMVNIGGFDTHDNQISEQAERMAQIDHALAYFDTVLGGMPGGDLRSQVTAFTASEFGRTFTSNGDGTDHGWGAHHFIMGGAVNGTEVYGTFPAYSTANAQGVFSSPDQIQNGVLIPSTSVDHLAFTLGRWMGVPDGAMLGAYDGDPDAILPNLRRFNSSGHDLGFMRT